MTKCNFRGEMEKTSAIERNVWLEDNKVTSLLFLSRAYRNFVHVYLGQSVSSFCDYVTSVEECVKMIVALIINAKRNLIKIAQLIGLDRLRVSCNIGIDLLPLTIRMTGVSSQRRKAERKEERNVESCLVEATASFSRRVYIISHPVGSVERNGERIIYVSLLLWM